MTKEEYNKIAAMHHDFEVLEMAVKSLDEGVSVGLNNPLFNDREMLYYLNDDMVKFIRDSLEKVKRDMDNTTVDIAGLKTVHGYVQ